MFATHQLDRSMSFFKNLFGDDDALMAPSPDYSRSSASHLILV
jgi:hypothetical protein